jgi:hypothetical protein
MDTLTFIVLLIIGILGGIGTVVNDLKKEEVYDDFQDR